MKNPSLLSILKQHFGFESFRPLQEDIIQDALSGRDVFALLPTGGGKSLCFQLPALVRPGLTVVVSPLIALMKDQVNALQASGVAATFLNSSLDPDESRARLRGLHNAEYRLLYVAPERLMLSGFLSSLKEWNVTLIAVDEAHCVSEWGHDFRPEYRELSKLRELFPKVPMMALTATATSRVKTDIVNHLQLNDPGIYIASFNRPNLTYRIESKNSGYDQVVKFLKARKHESGIIYCQSRKSTESLADWLVEEGISARPYHAGLETDERSKNQDLFIRDEVQVICATIAFGMGINKPNVRFVIHYDLPKNIEGYYQETGRAGRDGLASECLLFFSAGDMAKQFHFIEQKEDAKERQIARDQLMQMVRYAESTECRRRALLGYFGEKFENVESCGACDNCFSPRTTFDGTIVAQKFLSTVYRIREKNGFSVGANHVVEILTGAKTEKILKWSHHELSTYAIGKEHSRKEWKVIGSELIRLGLLAQSQDKFGVLELTQEGRDTLVQRKPVTLTQPAQSTQTKVERMESAPKTKSKKSKDIEEEYDEDLFERLRKLRKKLADEKDVPAYIIFSDVALRQMARDYPANEKEFVKISGVGEKKLKEFSKAFLAEIAAHLKNPYFSNPIGA